MGDLLLAGWLVATCAVFAADESCTSCGGKVAVSGDFNHRKEPPYPRIEGAGPNAEALYHTLWPRFRLGLFDPANRVPYSKYTLKDNDLPAHGQVALELAAKRFSPESSSGASPA